jgi:hypothetical protein
MIRNHPHKVRKTLFFKDGKQSQEAKVDSGGIAGGM